MMALQEGTLTLFIFSLMTVVTGEIRFRNEPDTVTVYAGQTVYMRCDLYPDPTISASEVSVTWIKSDSLNRQKYISMRGHIVQAYADPDRYSVTGDPTLGEHDLMIRNVEYNDAGTYRCQVTQSSQIRESAAGRLTVRVPIPVPTCTMNPPSPRVGQRVTFYCEQRMHPSVNYEALSWWNGTSRTKISTQGRYSDGSIYFTRRLTESDRNQHFICSQGSALIDGERNCTLTPLPTIEISSLSNQNQAIEVVPTVKFVAEGSSATFSCNSNAGPVNRWVYGYGNQASKIRETKNRFLLSRDRTQLTVIRTTLADNGTAVRCIVLQADGNKLIAQSILNVLPSTNPDVTNRRIPPPPPPISTAPPETASPTRSPTTKPHTDEGTFTVDNPSTNNDNGARQSSPNSRSSGSKGSVQVVPTEISSSTDPRSNSDRAVEVTARGDGELASDTGAGKALPGGAMAPSQNHADLPKVQTGGGFKAGDTHQVAKNNKPGDTGNGSGIAGAVIGTLLIVALVVLLVFLIKTKRYPKSVPSWIPPHIIAALKRPIKKTGSTNESAKYSEKSTSKENASVRMKEIEVVVNPPPPEWQFRLKDVENNSRSGNATSPRNSHHLTPTGPIYENMQQQQQQQHDADPVYANLTPELSKSHGHLERNVDEDEDDDSLFSSDFDDDLDLEGEIAAEMASRTIDGQEKSDSLEERKSRNVEGLVYAQLDLGPDADKRSTIFIEGEKTQYAHIIQHGQSSKRK